jgi:peptide/nickel transport system substrate-binding protein
VKAHGHSLKCLAPRLATGKSRKTGKRGVRHLVTGHLLTEAGKHFVGGHHRVVQRRVSRTCAVIVVLLSATAFAAARARDGGTLVVLLTQELSLESGELTPEGASVRALTSAPLCRLEANGQVHGLLATVERNPEGLTVTPRPGARFPSGAALSPAELAAAWLRALDAGPTARGLLAPVRAVRESLASQAQSRAPSLSLPLAHPWPDLEASLCHPALAPTRQAGSAREGIGPYAPTGQDRASAATDFPDGRPFPDDLVLRRVTRRVGLRTLQAHEAQLLIGDAGRSEGPLLAATYLAYRPARRVLAEAVAARLDRAALVRSFVPAPAAPLWGLLPPGLGGPREAARAAAPARQPGIATLLLDRDRPVQRAVAERLQILLNDAGVRVTLSARTGPELTADWERGEGDLALRTVLLPPIPAPALAVVLSLSGDGEANRRELPPLGAISDTEARAARVRERALALGTSLPLVPLYVEGIRARLDERLIDARRDAFGLWVLDDVWWP